MSALTELFGSDIIIFQVPLPVQTAGGFRYPDFRLQPQQQRNWCWVSVLQALLLHRCGWPSRQASIAAAVLRRPACLTDPAPCDEPFELFSYLEGVCGQFHWRGSRAPAWSGLKDQIELRYPALCLIQWGDGTHHYVVVTGWDEDGVEEAVLLWDPAHRVGEELVAFDALCGDYDEGQGKLVHTGFFRRRQC